MVSEEVLTQHNLTESEYQKIVDILKREPTLTELGIFSVMWSEHCSYKSSRVHLRRLPTRGPAVLQGPGENAGIIDIGDGLALAFKIESHNHPSFIEPFQGAATGVGGILRDIFTMGARPVAVLDSLRFPPVEDPKSRRLSEGVVSGIGWAGDFFGGPNLGGEVSRVPQRETGMTPYEIMLSESQERMLLVAARGRGEEIKRVFSKWELDAVEIGRVTDDGILRVKMGGHVVAEVPVSALADE